VLPWWALGLVSVVVLAMVPVLVCHESALRRRQRLSDVLRVGG
jgi:putative ABC transport system permease protein